MDAEIKIESAAMRKVIKGEVLTNRDIEVLEKIGVSGITYETEKMTNLFDVVVKQRIEKEKNITNININKSFIMNEVNVLGLEI
ncbi:MAG: hypothetical protein N4A47_07450 [Clostridia bacterium]|jgi:hypothetical protein|nr:hypothetical protein [Clostridia bacterium]